MYRTPLPKVLILLVMCGLVTAAAPGQIKPGREVDAAKCWSYPIQAGQRLATDGVLIFAASTGARVEALSLDGKKVWTTELGGELGSNLLAVENSLFLVTSAISGDGTAGSSVLRNLSKDTGVTSWTAKLPDASHFLGSANGSVTVVSSSGVIHSIDPKAGAIKWKREIASGFSGKPLFAGDRLIVATTANQLFTISLGSGEIESMRKLTSGATALAVLQNGGLVVGDERGSIASLTNGERVNWSVKSGGSVSMLIAVGNDIIAISNDNFVYFLTGRNGGLVWKKRLSGRASQVATADGKYVVVSTFDEPGVLLLDLSSGRVAGRTALGADETLVSEPLASNGVILFQTNEAIESFSLNGCGKKQEAAASK
jgi:outer membrane protein assembly factor BamB